MNPNPTPVIPAVNTNNNNNNWTWSQNNQPQTTAPNNNLMNMFNPPTQSVAPMNKPPANQFDVTSLNLNTPLTNTQTKPAVNQNLNLQSDLHLLDGAKKAEMLMNPSTANDEFDNFQTANTQGAQEKKQPNANVENLSFFFNFF